MYLGVISRPVAIGPAPRVPPRANPSPPIIFNPPEQPPTPILPVGPEYPIVWSPPAAPPLPPPVATAPTPSAANVNTPVPYGYSTSQIFVNSDGSFWEYSSSQNKWLNVGTPYNTGATAAQQAQSSGIVPAGYPTNQPYYDASGNIWTYNASSGWTVTGSVFTGGSAAATVAPPATPASSAPIVSPNTGYQAVLDWLQGTDLLGSVGVNGIPNWIAAAGIGLIGWKLTHGSLQGRGR